MDRTLAAIRHWHVISGLPPTTDHPSVRMLRAAARRLRPHLRSRRPWRLPLLPLHIRRLRSVLVLSRPRHLLMLTLLTLGLRLGWRSASLAQMRVDHLHWLEDRLMIDLPTSKTDPTWQGRSVFIDFSPGMSRFHPVALLQRYIRVFQRRPGQPLWAHFGPRRAFRPHDVSAIVKEAASVLQLAGRYSGHSLRIGAATAMAEAGVEKHVIMQTCGWASNVFEQVYLRFARSTRGDLSAAMGLA